LQETSKPDRCLGERDILFCDSDQSILAWFDAVNEATEGTEYPERAIISWVKERDKIMSNESKQIPLYCGLPGSRKWQDEIPIIQRIADQYRDTSIHIFEQPEFAVVEAVLRCADEVGFVLVRKAPVAP
jgi:hypothetical protein